MAEEVKDVAPVAPKPKASLFSKKNRKLLKDPLNDSNPITVQVLGICSALAITVQVQQAVIMSLSVLFVMIGANMLISIMRNVIPDRIRIIVQLVVVAALVIIVNETLKAFLPDISEKLSVFVGLIITNCIIMGRLEAFALGNKPGPSFLDAIGNAVGYAWILLAVALVRELFGSGAISLPGMGQVKFIPTEWFYGAAKDADVYKGFFENNNLFILPPMALIVVGIIIWIQRSKNTALIEEN
ncbi:MAG: NADH:ubiquinone reductase (Na(+)-transporting) subunit D, partial [Bacteroidota bacterium]